MGHYEVLYASARYRDFRIETDLLQSRQSLSLQCEQTQSGPDKESLGRFLLYCL